MIDIPDTQIQTAFSAEENDIDIIIMGSGSCVNPSRMFWYTPKEIFDDAETQTEIGRAHV